MNGYGGGGPRLNGTASRNGGDDDKENNSFRDSKKSTELPQCSCSNNGHGGAEGNGQVSNNCNVDMIGDQAGSAGDNVEYHVINNDHNGNGHQGQDVTGEQNDLTKDETLCELDQEVAVSVAQEQEEEKFDEQENDQAQSSGHNSPASTLSARSSPSASVSRGLDRTFVPGIDASPPPIQPAPLLDGAQFDFLDLDIDPRDRSDSSSSSCNDLPPQQSDDSLPATPPPFVQRCHKFSAAPDLRASSSSSKPGCSYAKNGTWSDDGQGDNDWRDDECDDVRDTTCNRLTSSASDYWRHGCMTDCVHCNMARNQPDASTSTETAASTHYSSPPNRRLYVIGPTGHRITHRLLQLAARRTENCQKWSSGHYNEAVLNDMYRTFSREKPTVARNPSALVSLLTPSRLAQLHRLHDLADFGPSSCGQTALLDVLHSLGYTSIKSHIVDVNLRCTTSGIGTYLVSRACAGTAHQQLIDAVHSYTDAKVTGLFASLEHAGDNLNMADVCRQLMALGAVPLLTLNMQMEVMQNPVDDTCLVADAWHHQVVHQVSHDDKVSLLNPSVSRWPCELRAMLTCDRVLLIRSDDVYAAWQRGRDLSPVLLAALDDIRWTQLNVLGQVMAVIRERESDNDNELGISHVVIPAAYTPGVTAFFYAQSTHRPIIQAVLNNANNNIVIDSLS